MNPCMPTRLPTVTKPLRKRLKTESKRSSIGEQRRRAETVDLVGEGEPRTKNAAEIFEVNGGDGSGRAAMDEGEGRTICHSGKICNLEGWRQRSRKRGQRKARRSRRLFDLIQP